MPIISIIIRTKNEEDWIGHCLEMVYKQDFKNFEVILVDNNSYDNTVGVAKRYPLTNIINIKNFLPGLALNEGIRSSSGEYIVCLSAHCVPQKTNWLSKLIVNFDGNLKVAGVYGRQLPVSFTDSVDKRDLLITFGRDKRTQIKDYFFHNANSMIRRDVWDKFPFDETATNIEDRVWGKDVTTGGYHIIYDPEPAVYHHHGLHQGNIKKRVNGVVSIIESLDGDMLNQLPESLKPENINISAVIPINCSIDKKSKLNGYLTNTLEALNNSKFINKTYVVSDTIDDAVNDSYWLNRKDIVNVNKLGLDRLMQESLKLIELTGDFPSLIFYMNYDYLYRNDTLIDELVLDRQYSGYNTVFPGYIDYGHYWFQDDDGEFHQNDPQLDSRDKRSPTYVALYGQGCLTSTSSIREGKLVSGKIGILPINEFKLTLRHNMGLQWA